MCTNSVIKHAEPLALLHSLTRLQSSENGCYIRLSCPYIATLPPIDDFIEIFYWDFVKFLEKINFLKCRTQVADTLDEDVGHL